MRERASELGGTVRLLPNDSARHPRARPAPGGAAVSANGPAVRVAIVDDHPMFRMGLAAAIDEMDGIELVGEAQRADRSPRSSADATPDVVLLDVRLGDGVGPGGQPVAGRAPPRASG